MLSGTFQRKLRRLNSDLRIYCGDNDDRPAMIEQPVNRCTGEYEPVCGVDKNELPELPEVDPTTGTIVRGGWRRAIDILIARRLVRKRAAEIEFATTFGRPDKYRWVKQDSVIDLAEKDAAERGARASLKRFGRLIPDYRLLEDEVALSRLYRERGLIE